MASGCSPWMTKKVVKALVLYVLFTKFYTSHISYSSLQVTRLGSIIITLLNLKYLSCSEPFLMHLYFFIYGFYTGDPNPTKGPSKNVNIFMSVQTVHFFRPPPLQEYRPTFLVSKIWVSRITFIVQQQKLTLILSLFDM